MASDFALPRFRYLEKLLIVHGHWCYSRLANMVLYFFYKNTVGVGRRQCQQATVTFRDLNVAMGRPQPRSLLLVPSSARVNCCQAWPSILSAQKLNSGLMKVPQGTSRGEGSGNR